MNKLQRASFTGFTISFICIVSLAFGVLIWAGIEKQKVHPVDNVAQPN